MDVIRAIRARRAEMNVPPSRKAELLIVTAQPEPYRQGLHFIQRLAYASEVRFASTAPADAVGQVSVVTHNATAYMPLAELVDLAAKLDIIRRCDDLGTPVISAMGCGNRFDPTKLVVTDIYKTQMDPLAKVIRRELRKDGIRKLKVVYSTEAPIPPYEDEEETTRRSLPGSTPFVPAAAGLIIASEVVRELTGFDPSKRLRGGRQK